MAISLRTAGTWTSASAGPSFVKTVADPHAAGDMLICRTTYKSATIATSACSTATSGWTKLGEFHDGTTDSGNGTGSVAVAVFWKEATSASEPNITIDYNNDATQLGAAVTVYQKGASDTWETPVGDGGGFTAGTNISATIQSHVAVASGDAVDFFYGVRDDTTATVPTITQTGITFDTVVENPATALSTTTGADLAADGGTRLATAGTSSAAAVVTGTLSTSESGSAWMTRLRVTAAAAERVPRSTPYPQLLAH